MRLYIILSIILCVVPLALAMEECQEDMIPRDIPCQVVTSWDYGTCSDYFVYIYNSTATLLGIAILDTYGETELCNFTFNYTAVDTYIFNSSAGDVGRINVMEDDEMLLAIGITFTLFAIFLVGLGTYILLRRKENAIR